MSVSLQALVHENVFFRCVEDSSEAIMVTDAKGTLAYVNPAWSRIYGFSFEEAVGDTPGLLHSGMQTDEFYRGMWSEIRDPERGFWKGELTNKAKDGTLVPVFLTITPYRGDKGEILGYMGVAIDLTHQKKLEEQVLRQDRLASIGLLASGLAHEIGTPLGVVRGRAELLIMRHGEQEKTVQDLELMIKQIDRISQLMQSLLKLGRSSHAEVKEVEIKSCMDEVVALMEQNFINRGVDLQLSVPPGVSAFTDFNRLQQVMMNLLTNALHATGEANSEGKVEQAKVSVEVSEEAENVLIRVKDNGVGISKENIKKLFEPFFTTKDVGKGTGLGLAIVLKLLHEMGGEIFVDSELGKGACFQVSLPKVK